MDEVLRRRLVGAGVLLAAAFAVSGLLPDAGPRSSRSVEHVVTYDLRTGQPIDRASPPPPKPAATAAPPVIETAPVQAPPQQDKEKEPAKAAPKPTQPAASATMSHPVLKVDESFGEKPATAKAAPPKPAPATEPPVKGGWFVQIGSFESQANASSVLKKLYGAGLPAVIQTVPAGNKLWYRVRVGPYAAESAANKVLGSMRAQGYKQAKLVKPESGPATGKN